MKKLYCPIFMVFVLSAAVFSMSFFGAWDSGAEKLYELKYQMSAGTKFVMTNTGTTESVLDQMGTEVVTDIEGRGEDTYVVLSSDKDKGLSIELEMGEQTQDVSSMMGSDSTDFSELVGKKVRFVLLPNGEVEGCEGFENLPEITTVTGDTMTEALYRLGVEQSFPMLPEKPVKAGDSWSDIQDIEVPLGSYVLNSHSDTKYTLIEEVKKDGFDCLKIETAGKETLTGDFEQQGTALSLERVTTSKGFMYFAHKKGMFLSVEIESNAEGIITVIDAGIDLPQTMNSKGTVSVRFE
jgi:hypothetical protein